MYLTLGHLYEFKYFHMCVCVCSNWTTTIGKWVYFLVGFLLTFTNNNNSLGKPLYGVFNPITTLLDLRKAEDVQVPLYVYAQLGLQMYVWLMYILGAYLVWYN